MALLEDLKERQKYDGTTADVSATLETQRANMEEMMGSIPATNAERMKVGAGQSFDRELFNKIFMDNRIPAENEEGLGDWLKNAVSSHESRKPVADVFSKQFNLSVFNKTFEASAEVSQALVA